MKKVLIFISIFSLAIFSFLSIPSFAASFVIINVADYLISKDFIGDEYILNYQLPVNPYYILYGKKTESGSAERLGSYRQLDFSQDIENNTTLISTNFLSFTVNCGLGETRTGVISSQYSGAFFERLSTLTEVYFNDVLVDFELNSNDSHLYAYHLRLYTKGSQDLLASYVFYSDSNADKVSYQFTNYTGDNALSLYGTESITQLVSTYEYIYFSHWPLGREKSEPRMIDITDIRSGSSFDITFNLDYTLVDTGALYEPFEMSVWFYDADFKLIDTQSFYIDNIINMDSISASFTVPEGAQYFYPRLNSGYIDVKQCNSVSYSTDSIELSVPLSALEENSKTLQQVATKLDALDGKIDGLIDGISSIEDVLRGTNDRLDDVNQGIQDTNDKLDGITDYIPTPSDPAGSDVVQDTDKTEQDLINDAIGNLDQLEDVKLSALEAILLYAGGFACVSTIIDLFARLPFFTGLLYVSLSLGIVSSLLSIANTVSSRSGKSHAGKE